MNKFSLYIAALTLCTISFSSCESEDEAAQENALIPINLSSSISGMTTARAGESSDVTSPTDFPGSVGVFFKPATSDYATVGYDKMYTYGTRGSTMVRYTGSQPYFPPTPDGKVSIRAWYPASASQGIGTGTVTFTIAQDQFEPNGYSISDLMVATADDIAPTTDTIPLTFRHLFAKVSVSLWAPYGYPLTAAITMHGIKPSVTFDIETITEDTVFTAIGTPIDLTLTTTSTDWHGNSAVLPAQTISKGTDLFTITLPDGNVYTFTTTEDITFAPGQQKVFKFTLSDLHLQGGDNGADPKTADAKKGTVFPTNE